jgi:3-phosphoshikimate 1-carboxyvinyltransferase
MAEGLATLGVGTKVLEDGIVIRGGVIGGTAAGREIRTYHDHRIAMSFAVAGLVAKEPIVVLDCDHVATSFPGFDILAAQLGLRISAENS